MMDDQLKGEWINEQCPRCGASLLGNKRGDKWCSNAGGALMSACSYGLDKCGTSIEELEGGS